MGPVWAHAARMLPVVLQVVPLSASVVPCMASRLYVASESGSDLGRHVLLKFSASSVMGLCVTLPQATAPPPQAQYHHTPLQHGPICRQLASIVQRS